MSKFSKTGNEANGNEAVAQQGVPADATRPAGFVVHSLRSAPLNAGVCGRKMAMTVTQALAVLEEARPEHLKLGKQMHEAYGGAAALHDGHFALAGDHAHRSCGRLMPAIEAPCEGLNPDPSRVMWKR